MSKTTTIQKNSIIEKLIFIGLCILLFYPPFFRGLFFEKELLPTHIFSFILCIIWIVVNFKNKEYKIIKTPTDLFALGVVFMYLISIFYAVNIRLAILEALKYMNYFVIYLLARDIIKDEKRRKIILNVLLASAFIVSIIGLGSAIGTWNYNGAFVSNRINSTFQYPNTLASYLAAIFIITISMILNERNRKFKSIYGFLVSTILITFILTYSRGMWLIFPFILVLYIILIPNDRKLETFMYLAINVIISTPIAFLFEKYIDIKPNICWLIVIGAGLLSTILTNLISILEERIKLVSIKKITGGLLIVFIAFSAFTLLAINTTTSLTLQNNTNKEQWTSVIREVGGISSNKDYKINIDYNGEIEEENQYAGRIVLQSIDKEGKAKNLKIIEAKDINENEIIEIFTTEENIDTLKIILQNYYKGTSITFNEVKIFDNSSNLIKNIPLKYKYIPESIVSRINSINLKENSAQARLAFYNDGMRVIKDYLLLGTGGGGWNTLFRMYQSFDYYTTKAHNYYLQMWIEIGLVGLLFFVLFIVLISYTTYKLYRQNKENTKILIVGVYLAALSILIHAFMDFDLSLSALTLVLWALLGILSNIANTNFNQSNNYLNSQYTKSILVVILAILIIFSGSFILGNSYAKNAIKSLKNDNDLDEAINYFQKATKYYPFKPEYKIDLANLYKNKYKKTKDKENILKAKELSDNTFKLVKYDPKYFSSLASLYMSIGYVGNGLELMDRKVELNPMKVESYFEKSQAYRQAFNYYLNQKKDVEKAKEFLERAYRIKDEIKQANEVALKPLKYNEDFLNNIGFIQFNYENLKKHEYPLEKDYILKFAYYFDLDMDNDGKIDKLRTYNTKDGNVSYGLKNEESSFIRVKNTGQTYGIVYPYGISLKPDTNYKIYFKARGTVKDGTFGFYLIDNKSNKSNQGGLSKIELKNNWEIFSCGIKTTSDIGTTTPYLGFFHYGNDDGYIDIEEVVIFEER